MAFLAFLFVTAALMSTILSVVEGCSCNSTSTNPYYSSTGPGAMLERVFTTLSQNRPLCPANINGQGALDALDPTNAAQSWKCNVPLTTPDALGLCIKAFVQEYTKAVQGQCVAGMRSICIYYPLNGGVASSASLDVNRIDRLENAIWNAPYQANLQAYFAQINTPKNGLDPSGFAPSPPLGPYPGQQSILASISQLPCTAFVSDASPLPALLGLMLRNGWACVLDKQLYERVLTLVNALHAVNVQCSAGMCPCQSLPANSANNPSANASVNSASGSPSSSLLNQLDAILAM